MQNGRSSTPIEYALQLRSLQDKADDLRDGLDEFRKLFVEGAAPPSTEPSTTAAGQAILRSVLDEDSA